MRNTIANGAVSGLIAGTAFGILMTVMSAPMPDGTRAPMMRMVAEVVGSESLVVGWIYHLFNSAVIGAIFGRVFGLQVRGWSSGLLQGAGYGFAWWVLGGLILMPMFLGMAAFAPLANPEMRVVAVGSLIGHLIYGVILGGCFQSFRYKPLRAEAEVRLRERERPVARRR